MPRLSRRTHRSTWHACERLDEEGYGTPTYGDDDGFRKTYAQERYKTLRAEGLSDEGTRLKVAQELGHNRSRVPLFVRPGGGGVGSGPLTGSGTGHTAQAQSPGSEGRRLLGCHVAPGGLRSNSPSPTSGCCARRRRVPPG